MVPIGYPIGTTLIGYPIGTTAAPAAAVLLLRQSQLSVAAAAVYMFTFRVLPLGWYLCYLYGGTLPIGYPIGTTLIGYPIGTAAAAAGAAGAAAAPTVCCCCCYINVYPKGFPENSTLNMP